MALDSVPWFVGGGAQHSPEIARLIAYAAFKGAEGVLGIGDLKVTQLDVPGAGAKVAAGAGVMANKASGGALQSYVARNPAADSTAVTFAATGSGVTRSDLVVLRVEDPFLAGEPWADPVDPTVGPYVFLRVIPNVSPTATTMPAGMTGIPLARVDFPASTATVTDSMITDLRTIADPRSLRVQRNKFVTGTNNAPTATGVWTAWPAVSSESIAVPVWATKGIIRATIATALEVLGSGSFIGQARYTIGAQSTQVVGLALEEGPRHTITITGEVTIPFAMRGTTQTHKLEINRSSGPGTLQADSNTTVAIDIDWQETAL